MGGCHVRGRGNACLWQAAKLVQMPACLDQINAMQNKMSISQHKMGKVRQWKWGHNGKVSHMYVQNVAMFVVVVVVRNKGLWEGKGK